MYTYTTNSLYIENHWHFLEVSSRLPWHRLEDIFPYILVVCHNAGVIESRLWDIWRWTALKMRFWFLRVINWYKIMFLYFYWQFCQIFRFKLYSIFTLVHFTGMIPKNLRGFWNICWYEWTFEGCTYSNYGQLEF